MTLPQLSCQTKQPPLRQCPQNRIHHHMGQPELLGGCKCGNSYVRTEAPITTPFPREMQVPPFLMGCLAASQPRTRSLTLLKCRAPYFPQLGVKVSSLTSRIKPEGSNSTWSFLQRQFEGAESFSIRLTEGLTELEAEHRPHTDLPSLSSVPHSRQPPAFSAVRKIFIKKEK